MKFADLILTIIVTATVTSMVWIVAGGSLIENARSDSQIEKTSPAAAAPSPTGPASPSQAGLETPISDQARNAASLNTRVVRAPAAGQTADLLIPVLNVRPADLSDTFTDSRGGGSRLHEAIDIMAPRGTSVVAAAPGEIERLFRSDAGGNTIYVRSADGETIHYYAHMDEYAEGLREGQRVRRGRRRNARERRTPYRRTCKQRLALSRSRVRIPTVWAKHLLVSLCKVSYVECREC